MTSISSTKFTLGLAYKRWPTIVKYIFACTTLIICAFAFAFLLSKLVVQQVDFTAPTSPLDADVGLVHQLVCEANRFSSS